MNEHLSNLKPERIWHYFKEILEIPRPSKQEEKISAYIQEFGKKNNLETLIDETGNILIRKPASTGFERLKTICLQSHIDMVCEKNSGTDFDFSTDTIRTKIEDNWVTAEGTTLGADDGIGIATQLAILESKTIEHGPLECLFTVDEETGLTGAFGLKSGFLKSDILLNLDSEDDGELFIGCAGGVDTVVEIPYLKEEAPKDMASYLISVNGLKGGHSGDDIYKGRGNANKILNRILWDCSNQFQLRLSKFDGGKLRNAIARESYAIVCIPERFQESMEEYLVGFKKNIKNELYITDPGVNIEFSATKLPGFLIDNTTQKNLLNALYACPHGVFAMSQDIPGFVETSTNLAAVKTRENSFHITTSQRSSVESAKINIRNMVAATFRLIGAKITHSDGYPGWTPNPDSEIVKITEDLYKHLFNETPKVLAVHAGLECGLIGDKYPEMDMISYGPTIKGAHSPDEKIDIHTVEKFWDLTLEVLKKIPVKK